MSEYQTLEVTGAITDTGSTVTLTEGPGNDYELPSGCDNTNSFAYLVNSHLTGRGRASGGGNQNIDLLTCTVDSSAIETQIVVTRDGALANYDCTFTLHVLCFTGSTSSPLRMQVLLHETKATQVTTGFYTSDFTPTDTSRVLPFITGQRSTEVARTHPQLFKFTAGALEASGSDYKILMTRGGADESIAGSASYAILQFGPGWDPVRREAFSLDEADDPSVTPGTAMTAWSTSDSTPYGIVSLSSPLRNILETVIHVQYTIDSEAVQGNDDASVVVEVDVGRLTDSAHADHSASPESHLIVRSRTMALSSLKELVVWILSPGLGARGMNVQHLTRYFDTTGTTEEQEDNSDTTDNSWTPAYAGVTALTNACALGQANSDGSGAGTPRGFTDFQLPSTSVLRMVRSESAQEERQYVQVVEWPDWVGWTGVFRSWEQRRAGLTEWDQPMNVPAAEQRRSGAETSEPSSPNLVAWEQRRAGLTEWE